MYLNETSDESHDTTHLERYEPYFLEIKIKPIQFHENPESETNQDCVEKSISKKSRSKQRKCVVHIGPS